MKKFDSFKQHYALDKAIEVIDVLTLNALPHALNEKHSHHDNYEIYWFLEGDVAFAFEGEIIDVAPGDMIIISSRKLHRPIIKNACRFHRKHIFFKEEVFGSMKANGLSLRNVIRERKIIKLNAAQIQESGLDRLFLDIEQYVAAEGGYEEFCALTTLFYFLIKADKISNRSIVKQSSITSNKVSTIVKYIDDNISKELNYKALAERFFVSEKNLYKIFKQETGFTLGKYILNRRIIKAKTVLNAGGSAADAARIAGFKDYSVFYRNFLKETGVAPTAFSKQ